jgi:enamine deaminase RidA (YjgF/YER057c/UK114 family)
VTRFEIVNPEALGRPRGFSHGILAPAGGRVLFIAGQTAPDAGHAEADRTGAEGRMVEQFGAALDRVVAVVSDAGGRPEHVARLTVYVTDMDAYRGARGRLGDVWRAAMGRHYPAMALVEVRSLVDPAAVIEIEATAVLPPGPEPAGAAG